MSIAKITITVFQKEELLPEELDVIEKCIRNYPAECAIKQWLPSTLVSKIDVVASTV